MRLIPNCGFLVLAVSCAFWSGCSKPDSQGGRPWRDFVRDLSDLDRFPLLDTTTAHLISSYDRTGGNDDFNNFAAPGSEPGWVTIADLSGPGCVRRFWTTGVDYGHPFKFYFDGEKKPRVSANVEDLFGGTYPFTPPLAQYLNISWHSYVPLTFNKSLRIETKAPPTHPFWGPRRLFFQLNVESLPPGTAIETFPRKFSAEDKAAVEQASTAWRAAVEWPDSGLPPTTNATISAGTIATVFAATGGPAVLNRFRLKVEPQSPSEWQPSRRAQLVQDVVLRVFYDDAAEPSIDVPVGDFFCNAWRTRHFGSLPLGSGTNGYVCSLPMPFQKAVRIELVNYADKSVVVEFAAEESGSRVEGRGDVGGSSGEGRGEDSSAPPDPRPSSLGYLHAIWQQSGPAAGKPHVFADIQGRGKLAGTYLGVTGIENSWWILEGDESFYVDGEKNPSWHGTGLEDYFNGGWYYRGAAFSAFHGIMDRAPFRTGQYRFHLVDPVVFEKSLRMEIERGDQNVSQGYFRSVVYAYLDRPTPVPPCPAEPAQRRSIEHPNLRQTFMLQLVELERMNDFASALAYIEEYTRLFPDPRETPLYLLRALEYRRLLGQNVTEEDYAPFLKGEYGDGPKQQAELLKWFHATPTAALVSMNVNGKGRAFLDGQEILGGDHPFMLFVAGVDLKAGAHILAAAVEMTRQEPWVQLAIRTHEGILGTGPGTLATRKPTSDWNQPGANLPGWARTMTPDALRGTPDAPFIGGVPNAFVLLQSKVYAIRAADWGYYQGTAYFRIDFSVPGPLVTDFPPLMTGLAQ
jgi:hypothetical protein